MRPAIELSESSGEAGPSSDSSSPLAEAVREHVEHAAVAGGSETKGYAVIVSKEAIKRLKRIALDTRCVLTCEDSSWLLELAEALDGEKLPPTERAPSAYPLEVST